MTSSTSQQVVRRTCDIPSTCVPIPHNCIDTHHTSDSDIRYLWNFNQVFDLQNIRPVKISTYVICTYVYSWTIYHPLSGPDLAINSTTDLAPYLDKLKTQLKLLGSALGIQDETAAIEKTSEDSTTKCLRVLEHWLKVTANPSWSLLCSKLKMCDSFNNVREQIEKDHFQ